jgi:DNA mismatch repair protein MutL
MRQRIKRLDNNLINRICAGEVVERPASALKEIIENSLDAEATTISVELQQGGIKLIKVIDDGVGIEAEDLPLALERHATSKISQEQDLYSILTLGFRGEGVASIASVSWFNLASKPKLQDLGYQISSIFGDIQELKPMAMNLGTLVEVQDLYHNIPARKKFLKSDTTEYSHCRNVFERLALSHPNIAFRLLHNDKEIYNLVAGDLLTRIDNIYSGYASEQAILIDESAGFLKLNGYVFHPAYLGNNNKNVQLFFVNGRYVRDKIVQNALKQAFSGIIHHEHQANYVLFLTIDPSEIDVNVHPNKTEVRFRDSNSIHSFLSRSIKKNLALPLTATQASLNDHNQLSNSNLTIELAPVKAETSFLTQTETVNNNPTIAPSKTHNPLTNLRNPVYNIHANQPVKSELVRQWLGEDNLSKADKSTFEPNSIEPNIYQANLNFSNNSPMVASMSDSLTDVTIFPPLGFALAQLQGIYILAQTKDGMIVVDMHAAHERIVLEKLKQQLLNQNIVAQQLLIPLVIDSEIVWLETMQLYTNELTQLGFDLGVNIDNQIIIKSIPLLLDLNQAKQLVQRLLADLTNFGSSNCLEQHQEQILATLACHSALRANHQLTISEMNALLREMEQTQFAHYCNHGRPTWFKLTMPELDAMFMRGK